MLRLVFALLTTLPAVSVALAEPPNPSRLLFAMGNEWVQFDGDKEDGIFRLYAAAIDENGKIKDFPNFFLFNCGEDYRHLTMHLPESYAFENFDVSTWIPETVVFARDFSGTYKLDAELNHNEFYFDFDEGVFVSLAQILGGQGAEFKVGPGMESLRLAFGGAELNPAQSDLLSSNGRTITGRFGLPDVAKHCFSGDEPPGAAWQVVGDVSCPDCDGSAGKTSSGIEVGSQAASYIVDYPTCMATMTAFIGSLASQNMASNLQCVRAK